MCVFTECIPIFGFLESLGSMCTGLKQALDSDKCDPCKLNFAKFHFLTVG